MLYQSKTCIMSVHRTISQFLESRTGIMIFRLIQFIYIAMFCVMIVLNLMKDPIQPVILTGCVIMLLWGIWMIRIDYVKTKNRLAGTKS